MLIKKKIIISLFFHFRATSFDENDLGKGGSFITELQNLSVMLARSTIRPTFRMSFRKKKLVRAPVLNKPRQNIYISKESLINVKFGNKIWCREFLRFEIQGSW